MKTSLHLLSLIFLVASSVAQMSDPPVTKITYRHIAPNITPEAFAAKPKTMYRAGDKYGRIEEQPDPPAGIHGLVIVSEPDIWMLNLLNKTANYGRDTPSGVFHAHIIPQQHFPKEFFPLEFGRELEFFHANHAKELGATEIDQHKCSGYQLERGNSRVLLYVDAETKFPFHIDVYLDGRNVFSIRYIDYQPNLPFDPTLLQSPKDVTIVEATDKQSLPKGDTEKKDSVR